MERLTERTSIGVLVKEDYGEKALKNLYSCNGGKPNPHYTNCDEGYCAMEKLAAYEDADEQGLLLWLPCKVGDSVYCMFSRYNKCTHNNKEFDEYDCQGCQQDECDSKIEKYIQDMRAFSLDWIVTNLKNFGKTVFLTKSEAEAKLKEMEGSHDENRSV